MAQFLAPPLLPLLTLSGVTTTPYVYYLGSEYSASSNTVDSVTVMKRPLPLDPSVSLQHQILIANLPVASARSGQEAPTAFECLHTIARCLISPYFESHTRGESEQSVRRGKGIDEAKTGSLASRGTKWQEFHSRRRRSRSSSCLYCISSRMLRFRRSRCLFRHSSKTPSHR